MTPWRFKMLPELAGCFFCAAFLWTAFAVPVAVAAPPVEVREYVNQFGVSPQRAEQVLANQHRGAEADIAERLERKLGDRYAGVWFDDEGNEFVVPILESVSHDEVGEAFAGAGLGSVDFRTPPARSSWRRLEIAQGELNAFLSQIGVGHHVQTSIDPRTNSIVVNEEHDTPPQLSSRIHGAIEEMNVPVHRGEGRLIPSNPVPMACGWGSCDPPLRGGVQLGEFGCTVGFKAIGVGNGARYVLSAGHCAENPFVPEFVAYTANGAAHWLGFTEAAYWGTSGHDLVKIRANGSQTWDTNPWPAEVVLASHEPIWSQTSNQVITNEGKSFIGEYACHTGLSTGTSCGTVARMDLSVDGVFEGRHAIVNHLTELAGVCTAAGDSGGPVFAGGTALGITSFGNGEATECGKNQYDWYSEITEDDDFLGVQVASRGGPPTATTSNVTNISWNRATLNGTVNPNGLPTTYYFQYGTTTGYGSATGAQNAGSGWSPVSASANTGFLNPGTPYHYRLVSTNSAGTTYGSDQTFTSGSAGAFFSDAPDNNTITNWSYSSSNGWQQEFLYGHPIAAGTSPATLKINGYPNVFYVDASNNNTITDWSWNPSTGWQQTFFYGHSVAAGTSPSAVLDAGGTAHVYFVDANDSNTISEWNSYGGWHQGYLYGHPVAAKSSPSAIAESNGTVHVYFVDSSDSNTITEWNSEAGWHQAFLWGDSATAGTSPSGVMNGVTPEVYFVDANRSNTITNWSSYGGWHQTFLYGHHDAANSSPSAVRESNGTVHVWFVDSSDSNTITEWNSEAGWHQTFLWGDSAAAGTSPSGLMNGVTPEIYFVDANKSNTITNWNSYGGWHQTFLYGHAVSASSSPAGL
jgi:hypothetical protein